MSKKSYILIFIIGISIPRVVAQIPCQGVAGFVDELRQVFSKFPPKPRNEATADSILSELRNIDSRLLHNATVLSKKYTLLNADQRTCVVNQFLAAPADSDRDVNFWFDHVSKRIPYSLRSPEFRRGFGVHVDISQGAVGLGTASESYSAAARALLSYTVGKGGQDTGGRWRGLFGLSTYYEYNGFLFCINPRVEYRIKDFALGNLTTIGNLKAIVDTNFGDATIVGGGLGAELHVGGIQILYQRDLDVSQSYILIGLFIRAFN